MGMKEHGRDDADKLIARGKQVLRIEAQAITELIEKLGPGFYEAVMLLYQCQGKVVVTGVGKSGLICQKIAATLASTGTPAIFLHPVEGFHGDLGVLARGDVMIALSNSGETKEVNRLLPIVKRMGVPLIVFTGKAESTLARFGDVVLDTSVKEEACPMNLVPTASTTAALAVGDALAVTLLEKRGFKEEDFAMLHPGGALGRRLLYRVEDLMHTGDAVPLVSHKILIKEAIIEMTSKRFGVTGVLDDSGNFIGVITDGDLRRGLEMGGDLFACRISEIMTRNPKTIFRDNLAAKALQRIEQYSITSLFVVKREDEKKVEGIIHIHDLLKAGIA